ncbi:carboxypeptidase-like regulatory domain-containing protein [Hymenobacter sp. BT188]|nr:carboxypeptidase-like regulatory domain-containing protein [Hymenobacter sp. BT188]
MVRYSTVCVLLLLSHFALAQQRITGNVVDAATDRPIPYASITVLNTRLGTTSNADGEFELKTVPLPGKVVVSHLSYARDTLTVAAAQPLQIRMQPASVLLAEAPVGGYLEELIKKAYRQLRQSNTQKTYGQAFYRQTTQLDGDATKVQEMIWNTKTSSAGMEGTTLAQARYAKKKSLVSFKNFSAYTKTVVLFDPKADSAASKSLLGPNVARNFTLSLVGVTQNGPQQLVEIGFKRKTDDKQNTEQGSIIIDETTHQILRLQLETPGMPIKLNAPGYRFKEQTLAFELVFQPAPDGAVLEYTKVSIRAAVDRPLKGDLRIQTSSFTYFYDGRPTPTGLAYAPVKKGESDLETIKQTTYEPAFWQKSSVVKRTPLEEGIIKSFEQKGAFGTLLSH